MYEDVLAKRGRLLKYLRSKNISGVVSVAMTKQDNLLALLVLTESSFTGTVPERFEGTPVVVASTKPASAQLRALTTA